jgi:2-methylcitrate dehydratase PrpD
MDVTAALARFVVDCRWQDVPAAVRREAMRSLLNFFAVSCAGCREPPVQKAVQALLPFTAARTASLIGRGERLDLFNAAFVNAMAANVFDFDDTHPSTIIHPTAPVAPALFAYAETYGLSGEALLLAFVLGVEVQCRIGNAISPGHYRRGWHITSTCGVFGAAVAAGKAVGLDLQSLTWALGNASVQTGGLVEALGTMSKSISVGNAAKNGLLAALLARDGFSGPARPLEGERGFLRVAADEPKLSAVCDRLGDRWELLTNTYKPYPCGVVLNPVVEACIALASDARLSLPDVDRVEIVGHPLLRERTDRPGVRTGRESQVSAQHAVAVALTRAKAGLAEFSDDAVSDGSLQALGCKVAFVDDDRYSVDSARVTVRQRSGPSLERFVEHAYGGPLRPMGDADLEDKLRQLMAYGRVGRDPVPLIGAIWNLDRARDAANAMTLARGEQHDEGAS